MKKVNRPEKKSSGASTLKSRLAKKKEELKKKEQRGNVLFLKEGTIRVRILPTGEDNDFVMEINTLYLGPSIGGITSPTTFGDPCAFREEYNRLSASKNPEDKIIAKALSERKKYLIPCIIYKDLKGREIDTDKGTKLVQVTGSMYQEIIDYYLDDDDWGDMTDPKNGYDLKLIRAGSGKNDTTYSVAPCKNSAIPKEYHKPIDLEEMVRGEIPTYEETQDKLNEFMMSYTPAGDDDEDDAPKKKSKKSFKKRDI